MTIGINLLREAREKFAAAVAAVKDELKNPDTTDEVRPAAIELGSAFDEHLTDLGNELGAGFAIQPAPNEAEPAAAEVIQDEAAARDAENENLAQ